MDNLSELDDCINTLEQLQLSLDFESSTVRRVPKDDVGSLSPRMCNERPRIKCESKPPLQLVNYGDFYEEHYQDFSPYPVVIDNERQSEKEVDDDYPKSLIEMLDFQSVSFRRPKLMSSKGGESDLLPVPECDSTDFLPPANILSVGSDNYIKTYSAHPHQHYQHSDSKNSSPISIDDTLSDRSNRNTSSGSITISPKISEQPPFSTIARTRYNNNHSESSSQSNISSYTEKEPKNMNALHLLDTLSIREDPSKQTVVRFFTADKTTKAILVREKMTIEEVIHVMMEKQFWIPSLKSAVVEKVPNLKMERFFEEHETLVSCINSWPSSCANMIFFEPRDDIYGLFDNGKAYLGDNYPSGSLNVDAIKNLFVTLTTNQHQYHDYLYIKKPGENTWKRKFCYLNHDGIYLIPKKKSKSPSLSIVMPFNDKFFLYTSTGGWIKLWNAPTPFGFAFKPYGVTDPKSTQIIMFCAADDISQKRWCSNIRLSKYQNQILNNYQHLQNRSLYCSNVYSANKHNGRLNSLSPDISSKSSSYSFHTRQSSLPTSNLRYTKSNSKKIK